MEERSPSQKHKKEIEMMKMVYRLRLMFRRAIRKVKRINVRHDEWEEKHPIENSIILTLVGGIVVVLCVFPDVCESPFLALLIMVVDGLLGLVFGIACYFSMRWEKYGKRQAHHKGAERI